MEASADRSALARASSYLNYRAAARWTAIVCGVVIGLLYLALLILLGLFADLMVHRGMLPTYRELAKGERSDLHENWFAMPVPARKAILKDFVGKSETMKIGHRDYTKAEIEGRAELIAPNIDDPSSLSLDQQWGVIWQAYLHARLKKRVNEHAASAVRDNMREPHGSLGLVARSDLHGRFYAPILGWFSSWNGWMWQNGSAAFPPYLIGLFVLTMLLLILRTTLTVLMHESAARSSIEAASRLRRAVYHHTFRLGTLAFRALGPSEAVTIFTRHVEAVHDALHARLTVTLREALKFVLLVLFALIIHVWLSLAIILFAFLVWMLGGQLAAYFKGKGREASNQAAERLTLIRESLMMMRLVKCYMMELFNQARVERQLTVLSQAQQKRYRGEAIYRPVLMLMGGIAAICLLFVAGLIVLNGSFSVASALVMIVSLISLYQPLTQWLEQRKIIRRGKDAARNLFKFLDKPGDVGQVVGAEFLPTPSKRLDFDNVSLREPGSGRMLLDGVSLTIKTGQQIGLVGSDDLEKHAFVYLIPRLLDPHSGEIRIDDHNLRWVTLDSLRDKIGIVLTHNLVFHDTVANNIGCGDQTFSLPKIIEAAKMARAHQFISKLPKGYETPIGELGQSLSASQKYRIALARAIIRDPAIVLIEEPEEPFDAEAKDLIDDALGRFLPGRTVIFLPHRISTIKTCDRLYLLHKGRIEAAGSHKELLTANKLYRHLHYIEFNQVGEGT